MQLAAAAQRFPGTCHTLLWDSPPPTMALVSMCSSLGLAELFLFCIFPALQSPFGDRAKPEVDKLSVATRSI